MCDSGAICMNENVKSRCQKRRKTSWFARLNANSAKAWPLSDCEKKNAFDWNDKFVFELMQLNIKNEQKKTLNHSMAEQRKAISSQWFFMSVYLWRTKMKSFSHKKWHNSWFGRNFDQRRNDQHEKCVQMNFLCCRKKISAQFVLVSFYIQVEKLNRAPRRRSEHKKSIEFRVKNMLPLTRNTCCTRIIWIGYAAGYTPSSGNDS